MRRETRIGWVLLVAVAIGLFTPAAGVAQTDLAKALVGTWRGELVARVKRGSEATTALALRITSVKQENGRWIAEGRFGPNPVKIDIDTSGAKPSLRWTGAAGAKYDLNLLDERNLVGTATLTTEQAHRDRTVKLEKQQ